LQAEKEKEEEPFNPFIKPIIQMHKAEKSTLLPECSENAKRIIKHQQDTLSSLEKLKK